MPIRIHTHNGACHADEIVAIAILMEIFPDAVITRSRNPKDWEAADLVVDVGELLDYVKYFDHHQKEGKPEPRPNGVPYASAGLVLKTFGPKWVSALAAQHGLDPQAVVDCIDALFIQPIDAKDVGQIDLSARLKDKEGRIVQHEGRDVALATNDFNSLTRLFAPVDFLGGVEGQEGCGAVSARRHRRPQALHGKRTRAVHAHPRRRRGCRQKDPRLI